MPLTRALILSLVLAAPALAGGHGGTPEEKAVKARNATMTLYSYNLGILGDMAKEARPFDADLAQAAAAYLSAVAGAP